MNKKYLWLMMVLVTLSFVADAQGKLNLMNGKIILFDSIGKAGNEKYIYAIHANNESYSYTIGKRRIFSIVFADGREEIIFTSDSTISDLNVPQMKDFVKGEQDCWKYYKPKMVTVGGLVIGAGAGILGFYGPFFPAFYAIIETASAPPDIAKEPYADKAYANNEFYAYGFEIAAKKKKLKNALYGGGISFVTSFVAYTIISKHIH
jgi:hypothetical protein